MSTNTRVPDGQKMPRPWFRANNTAGPLFSIYKLENGWERVAPLAEGERRLGNFVLPPFQRPAVWSEAQKIRFIESIWNGLPLGAYIVNRIIVPLDNPYDNYLLDGQQRITAILDYVADAFPVLGQRWSELTKQDQTQFGMTPMSYLETQIGDLDELREIYDRLAYGGTAHDPKKPPVVDAPSEAQVNAAIEGTSYGRHEAFRLQFKLGQANMFLCEFANRRAEPHLLAAARDSLAEARAVLDQSVQMVVQTEAAIGVE